MGWSLIANKLLDKDNNTEHFENFIEAGVRMYNLKQRLLQVDDDPVSAARRYKILQNNSKFMAKTNDISMEENEY